MVRIRIEMIARVQGTGYRFCIEIESLEMKFACHAGNGKIKRLKYDRGDHDDEKSNASKDMIMRNQR